MSKNIIFFSLGLVAAVIAYIFNPSLIGLLDVIITERIPSDVSRMLLKNDVVAFAGGMSLFGITFIILYLLFPVTYVWHHIKSAKSIIVELPLVSNPTKRTDKKTFLSNLKGLGYISDLVDAYSPYLIQGPEIEVPAEEIKNTRFKQKLSSGNSNKPLTISPVRALMPSESIFNHNSLVSDHLTLGFFSVFARLLVGMGIAFLMMSVVSYSLIEAKHDTSLLVALQSGIVALFFCLVSAVIIASLKRMTNLILSHNSHGMARMIDGLFYQKDVMLNDRQKTDNKNEGADISEQIVSALKGGVEKPLREVSKAVKALSSEQEKNLDSILSKTLQSYSKSLDEKSAVEVETLNKSLAEAAQAADKMKKHFADTNTQFTKQMDKQSAGIAKHLAEMQKVLSNSEKVTQQGTEKIISSVGKEVDAAYKNLSKYMETSLKNLDRKQAEIEKKTKNKDSILQDLHNTAKDLGTISNASGKLLEKFTALSSELDGVLNHIKDAPIPSQNGGAGNRDKLKVAMRELKKANTDRIRDLPDM